MSVNMSSHMIQGTRIIIVPKASFEITTAILAELEESKTLAGTKNAVIINPFEYMFDEISRISELFNNMYESIGDRNTEPEYLEDVENSIDHAVDAMDKSEDIDLGTVRSLDHAGRDCKKIREEIIGYNKDVEGNLDDMRQILDKYGEASDNKGHRDAFWRAWHRR